MSRIDSLHVFTMVVKASSFTNAAQALGLTPSAVSKQISMLEERLGVRLLNRTTRTVNPTEAGCLLYERARRILEDIDETEQLVADLDTSPRGVLRITATPAFGRRQLARVFSDFLAQHPEVGFDLYLSDRPLDLIKEGFDLSLRLGPPSDSRLMSQSITSHEVILCASPEYLAAVPPIKALADLAHCHLLVVEGVEFSNPSWIKQFLRAHDLYHISMRLAVNDLDMVFESVLSGMGISALPTYMVKQHIEDGRLQQVLPEVKFPLRKVFAVYPQVRYISAKTRTFVDYLVEYFASQT